MMGRFSFFQSKGQPTRLSRVASKEQIHGEEKPQFDERLVRDAEMLAESGALERVFGRLRDEAIMSMTASTPGMNGMGEREAAHTRIRALSDIEAGLQAIIDDRKFYKKPAENE